MEHLKFSDLEVLQVHELISPLNLVALARIQLLTRIAIKAPEYVLQLVSASDAGGGSTWIAAVREDIHIVTLRGHFPSS